MSDPTPPEPIEEEDIKVDWASSKRVYKTIWGISWSVARWKMVVVLGLSVVSALGGALRNVVTREVVDALGVPPRAVSWSIILLVIIGVSLLLQEVSMLIMFDFGDRVTQVIDQKMMEIAGGVPGLEHLESPEFADKVKTVQNHSYVPIEMLFNLQSMTYVAVGLMTALFFLATIHPLLLLMPVVAIPSGYLQYRSQRKHMKVWDETAPEERLATHYITLATGSEGAKEVRLFGLARHLVSKHQEVTMAYIRRLFRDRLKRSGVSIATGAMYGSSLAVSVGFIGYLALNGQVSFGEVAMGIGLTNMVVGHIEMTASTIAWLAQLTYLGERYLWLLDYEPKVVVKPEGEAKPAPDVILDGIRFDHVSFTYPNTDKAVLTDIDLFIPGGSTVALVGENGAGKSSLVKLLNRFYDPTEGVILVDGVDLRDIDIEMWRTKTAAAFQDFVRFQLPAREAVGVGDLPAIEALSRITAAAKQAGADRIVDRLPSGYDTQLGRWFEGGVDISEGEWQRIAIARGSMRDNPAIVLLDEPTASLDARAEHEVFEQFALIAKGSGWHKPVTLLVSHRFSTVRMADFIVVLHEGGVEEVGSHDELMAGGKRYAELFNMQASHYD